jgi:hypothetical protein
MRKILGKCSSCDRADGGPCRAPPGCNVEHLVVGL